MSNNFSQLMDLASKQGFSRSSLMAEIKQAIIALYREQNPKAAIGIAVLIDEDTGLIKIFAGDNDVGSEKFSQEANQLAQKILIEKIAQGQSNISNQHNDGQNNLTKKAKRKGSGFLGKFFFWVYNIYFIFYNLAMTVALLIDQDFTSIIKNIEWMQVLIFLATFFLPIVTVVYVWRKGLHHQSGKLMKFFFFFELPLVVILSIFSNSIVYVTFFTALIIIACLSIPPLLYVHFSKVELSASASQIVAFFSRFSIVLFGYLSLLFSFLLPQLVIGAPKSYLEDYFFSEISYGYVANYPAQALELSVFLGIFLLILGVCALPFLYLRTLWKIIENSRQKLSEFLGESKAEKQLALSWIVIFILFLLSCLHWPNHRLLGQLIKFDQKADYLTQEASAIPLINEEEKLQKLVKRKVEISNAYWFDKDDEVLVEAYEDIFENEDFTRVLQSVFINLAYPLVYWESWEDQRALTDNFEYLFGYPYSQNFQGEDESKEENEKEVLLTYREITVNTETNGLLANITIEEEYQNQSRQDQEIIYEFNLPDETAFYDLKLGPNLEFKGIIAPKGAAQKVYEKELKRKRDPALLEQTGPNQYRLRIYPIPGNNDFDTLQGQRQRVSFSYSVLQNAGAFALPHYTKESNVLIDGSSSITLSYDGQISHLKEELNELPATSDQVLDLCQKQETINNLVEAGKTARVVFHANDPELQKIACGNVEELLPLLKDYRVAIVYDTSSNNQDDQTLDKFADFLSKADDNWLNEAQLDLYKFNQVVSQGEKITSDNFKDLLAPIHFSKVSDFSKLGEIKAQHDLVVLVTSQDIDFLQLKNFPFSKPSMVYWVSEEKLPALNMEMTSGLWQTGGGASTSIESALRNFLIKKTLAEKVRDNALAINQNLSLEYTGLSSNLSSDLFGGSSAFGKIANKGLLRKFVQEQEQEVVGNINQLDQLDLAARQANLVSPYSSLLALVNQEQLDNLEREMARYSRFQDAQMTENNWGGSWLPVGLTIVPDLISMESIMPSAGSLGSKSAGLGSLGIISSGSAGDDLGFANNMTDSSSLLYLSAAFVVIAIVIFLLQKLRNKLKK